MRIVQKYGGTSVGSFDRIRNVATRVKALYDEGHEVAVVVSAMSGMTNKLIGMAKEMSENPPEREMDVLVSTGEQQSIALLTIALQEMGIPAVSVTGRQAGVQTKGFNTRARIEKINPEYMNSILDEGKVVVAAGFQGLNEEGEIQTLGRGGSDLSAIALAHAVGADLCQILTDVNGVYTADPRVVRNAAKIDEISYEELLELASVGTKVMQSRSVEFAKKFNVPFEVRSSLNKEPGTLVIEEKSSMESVVIRGVSIERNQARVTVTGIPDEPGWSGKILKALGASDVNIDMIVSNIANDGLARHSFTMSSDDLGRAQAVLKPVLADLSGGNLETEAGIAKLSCVGIGMRSHSGVAASMFEALGEAGINIGMISTSEIKISVTVDEAQIETAAQVVHDAFDLGE